MYDDNDRLNNDSAREDNSDSPQYFNPNRGEADPENKDKGNADAADTEDAATESDGAEEHVDYGSYNSAEDDRTYEYNPKQFNSRYSGAQYGDKPDAGKPGDAPKKNGKGSAGKRAAMLILSGLLFGCAAGGAMVGVNRIAGSGSTAESSAAGTGSAGETSESIAEQQTSGTGTASGSAKPLDVADIVSDAMPSVVAINSTMVVTQNSFFFGEQQYQAKGSGSGIIAGQNDKELLIVTNNHVVDNSEELSVTFTDGTSVKAEIKGTDSDSDLAVIAVQLSDIPDATRDKIKVAKLGDSDNLRLGEGVIAIGNALGEGQSVTTGVVSALNKDVTIDGVTRSLIQVDAAINPGNSGGALRNLSGEVVGINSAKYSSTEVEGVGYAIPISKAKSIIDQLSQQKTKIEVDEDNQGYLGIQLQNIDSSMAKAYSMPEGIYVYKIIEGGAASRSDLHEKDIITKFDGQTVKTGEELQNLLKYYEGGTTVTLTVESLENGSYVEREVQITLGYRKDAKNLGGGSDSDQSGSSGETESGEGGSGDSSDGDSGSTDGESETGVGFH